MRVSTTDRPMVRSRVFTTDRELKDVLIADDEIGYALTYKRDAQGRFVIAPSRHHIETQEFWGPVFIERQRPPIPRR